MASSVVVVASIGYQKEPSAVQPEGESEVIFKIWR